MVDRWTRGKGTGGMAADRGGGTGAPSVGPMIGGM